MIARLGLAAIAAGMVCVGFITHGADAATCDGICDVLGADGDVAASPGGDPYHLVLTAGGGDGVGQIPGFGGVNGTTCTTDPFTAAAGQTLRLFFNFITTDSGFDGFPLADYAWAQLRTAGGEEVAWLFTGAGRRDRPRGCRARPSDGRRSSVVRIGRICRRPGRRARLVAARRCRLLRRGCGYTGWIRSDYLIQDAGSYILTFGVTNFLLGTEDFGLAFDGAVLDGSPSPVPLPAALPLFGASLVGLGAVARFGRRRGKAPAAA